MAGGETECAMFLELFELFVDTCHLPRTRIARTRCIRQIYITAAYEADSVLRVIVTRLKEITGEGK
jgi:hypothetical protein